MLNFEIESANLVRVEPPPPWKRPLSAAPLTEEKEPFAMPLESPPPIPGDPDKEESSRETPPFREAGGAPFEL